MSHARGPDFFSGGPIRPEAATLPATEAVGESFLAAGLAMGILPPGSPDPPPPAAAAGRAGEEALGSAPAPFGLKEDDGLPLLGAGLGAGAPMTLDAADPAPDALDGCGPTGPKDATSWTQSLQKILPQARQWCRRTVTLKGFAQLKHVRAQSSATQ